MFGIDDIILGATIAGAATSATGALGKASAQKKLNQAQYEEEQLRRTQMEYDSLRQSRQLVRNAQVARSIGLSNEVASGSQYGSAAGGLAGQAQGQQGVEGNKIYQNLQIGEQLFNKNFEEAQDKAKIAKQQD